MRASPLPVFHVVGGRDYYSHLPGYQHAVALAGLTPEPKPVEPDPFYQRLLDFRAKHVHVGPGNRADVDAGWARLNFAPEARPMAGEGIAENGAQLAALCIAHGINHIVYIGFAINWCLLMSPGGMVDMRRHGLICSTIRDATTAVENRETARDEREKEQGLWRFSLESGFVFDSKDFISALR